VTRCFKELPDPRFREALSILIKKHNQRCKEKNKSTVLYKETGGSTVALGKRFKIAH